jgi:hypothetical protein
MLAGTTLHSIPEDLKRWFSTTPLNNLAEMQTEGGRTLSTKMAKQRALTHLSFHLFKFTRVYKTKHRH